MHISDAGAPIFRGISKKIITNCQINSGQRLLRSKENYRPNTRQSGPTKFIYIKYLKIYFLIVLDKIRRRSAATPSFWLYRSTRRKQRKMKTPSIPGPGTAFLNFPSAVKLCIAWKSNWNKNYHYKKNIECLGRCISTPFFFLSDTLSHSIFLTWDRN